MGFNVYILELGDWEARGKLIGGERSKVSG